mmetsp:Transcript_137/g.167  ORF Transcript_137/g.167 Transcript_137/m.167 type:complete len:576 (+) Transcript_137:91-1818(+)
MSKPDPDPAPVENENGNPLLSEAKKSEMAAAFATAMSNMNDMAQNESDELTDAIEAADVATVSSQPLTYTNSKNGPFYKKAKELMQVGDFEGALGKIVMGITAILSIMKSDSNMQEDELHESLAPLYYMYGTTLLYSVEESQDTNADVMNQPQQQDQDQQAQDAAGDLEIAWENLESARSILSKMNDENDNGNSKNDEESKERILDLAQIHSRLADLSRHDGHYEQAIQDYESCCEARRNVLTEDQVYDRRIADVEYTLGMTGLLLAAEAEKNLMSEQEKDSGSGSGNGDNAAASGMVSALAAAAGIDASAQEENKVVLSPTEITALREKSLCHYVQCARILAGVIGSMSNDVTTSLSDLAAADSSLDTSMGDRQCAAKKIPSPEPSGKTTGLEEEDTSSTSNNNNTVQDKASKALSAIRDRVSALKAADPANVDKINDLREMLDEIQETIDNCETDRQGLRDVNLMRKKAEEDIRKEDAMGSGNGSTVDGASNGDGDGGMTTIGFGSAAASSTTAAASAPSSSAGATTIGFGSANDTTSATAAAAPMMVVKKKKKRAAPLQQVDAKKAKTVETE